MEEKENKRGSGNERRKLAAAAVDTHQGTPKTAAGGTGGQTARPVGWKHKLRTAMRTRSGTECATGGLRGGSSARTLLAGAASSSTSIALPCPPFLLCLFPLPLNSFGCSSMSAGGSS